MELLRIFETAFNAISPIVLLMALGYWLRLKGFFDETFLARSNRLVFRLLLPALLFANVYDIEGFASIPWDIVAYAIGAVLGLCLLGLGIGLITTKIPERRGVVAQSVFRANLAIVGLPLAITLGGQEATAVASVISSFTIALFNMLAVVVLTVFLDSGKGQKIRPLKILKDIATNPPVIGILLGFVCMALRSIQSSLWGAPVFTIRQDLPFLYTTISHLRSILTPFALLILGGQFSFSAIGNMRKELITGILCRLVLAPVLGLSVAIFLNAKGIIHCGPAEFPALIALLGSPVAVGSETMASQMGNDAQLATQLVVWSSVLSIFTLFLTVSIMMVLGFLPF